MADGQTTPVGNVEVLLMLESKEQIEAIWAKVKKKGFTVKMELEVQFWGAMYGRFVDDYGIGWQLNYNLPQ
jgi:PhnB protein